MKNNLEIAIATDFNLHYMTIDISDIENEPLLTTIRNSYPLLRALGANINPTKPKELKFFGSLSKNLEAYCIPMGELPLNKKINILNFPNAALGVIGEIIIIGVDEGGLFV